MESSEDEEKILTENLGGKADSEDLGHCSDKESDDKSVTSDSKSLEKTPSTSLVKYCSPGDPGHE